MKHFLWVLSLSVFLAGSIACNKNSSPAAAGKGTATLTLSATNLKRGAPLIVALNGNSSSNIRWAVTPSGSAHITSGNGQAMILFPQAGSYRITANYSSGADSSSDSVSSPVTVNDSIYSCPQPNNLDTTSMAGVQVTITPMLDSAARLVLLVQSTSVYDCFPTFIWADSTYPTYQQGASIGIALFEIISGSMYGSCNGAKNPAASYLFPEWNMTGPPPDGTYPIYVTMNNTTYQGSYTVTDKQFLFNWGYTSGVTISPMQINRP